MGAKSSSPRTVQIDNDSPVNVIDVSEAVVDRLKGLHTRDVQQQREHDRRVAEAAVAAARLEWEKQQQQQPPKQSTTQFVPAPATTIIHSGGATMSALEVRRQKEEELRKNDLYWQARLKKQEQDLQKTAAILEKEYNETFDQVRKRFENSAPQYQLPPFKEVKAKVVECYKSNASQTLNCAPIVADFENCVQTHRTNLLNEKYATPNKQPIAAAS